MFHKRNLRIDLTNWRGIMLSNFLANSPMTWLTHRLTTYATRKGLIPETQVATQRGVQTRDVISYLAGIKRFAQRNNQELYALQRDQMKGFDYLSPQGFYDAIQAYGLPAEIQALDFAAQHNTKVFIRTAFGMAGPIYVSGVTKQGGPMSPLKSTLTTTMGHRYLNDIATEEEGTLRIKTLNAKKNSPHTPEDLMMVQPTMVEAMDDSIIFATNLSTLRRFYLEMERFQFSYGWLTQWAKTILYALNAPEANIREKTLMPSITVEEGRIVEGTVTLHSVPMKVGEITFLKTEVDDTGSRFTELKHYIDNFNFPKFTSRTPVTLLRKIVSQCLISRTRALLSLQPVKHTEAGLLDKAIANKIHKLTGFPYQHNTDIMTLSLSCFGLDFPSITRINACIAIEGLARDLNHHIDTYRKLARITLNDWTCQLNRCVYPLDNIGLARNFTRHLGSIPAEWIIAQKLMSELKPRLELRRTNQNHILQERKTNAESLIKAFANLKQYPPSHREHEGKIWASDGSMYPANSGLLDRKTVVAAITGPATLVLKLYGRNSNILHGEVMGLIMGHILSSQIGVQQKLYSDHLNSVRFISDLDSNIDQSASLRSKNGRSYYRWLQDLRSRTNLQVLYTKAHTDGQSLEALLNDDADHYAADAQR
ncbi:hypothetical protein CVT26_008912 [Gymnopilus dilepis]|uniref:Reverse transcriptase domain-containing protein n=1 Tax=Gymnopilus dilepis TaxID=231916 RepID=A0A409YRS7_9AGAR|nr:hypothetical protein CVT26_008912 [Gymnopilus dilepis]